MDNPIWLGKKVYVKLKNSTRAYAGYVIAEDNISITINDIKNNLVKLNFEALDLLQEEQ